MPPCTHRQRYVNEDEIDPNTGNSMIFAILYFYNFITGYRYYSNDNEISLHFKSIRLTFMNYSV
jgi:hypothetical protein